MKTIDFPGSCDVFLHKNYKKGEGCVKVPGCLLVTIGMTGDLKHDHDGPFDSSIKDRTYQKGEEFCVRTTKVSDDVNFTFYGEDRKKYEYTLHTGTPSPCDESARFDDVHSVVGTVLSVACWSVFAGVAAAILYTLSSSPMSINNSEIER